MSYKYQIEIVVGVSDVPIMCMHAYEKHISRANIESHKWQDQLYDRQLRIMC